MFIVIETFDENYPCIVTDTEGYPLLFDNEDEANEEKKQCQCGVILEY